ncbi:DUF1648 domain-containing protein [Lactobacillus sp. CC-MHH1034]|uniref:DUF1648 domain-containing protein n=1 Tax=Agrilactobacillus fermenti TaxID=2586909 RepID=UPI001E54B28D|nr:DUF1648 domain-containing protein [Agrilactobacillus fermenti]MCD2256373.1 DUF1648 domain-containing protein [Agrilactobacillus fermenti]
MKHLSRFYWISSILTILPIVFGIIFYQQLPNKMAIHFGVDNTPNGFVTKPFAVFGILGLMLLLQLLMIGIYHFKGAQQFGNPRMQVVYFSIIPIISIVGYLVTIFYNLGTGVDVRRIIIFLVALIFIAIGNYLPTVEFESQQATHLFFTFKSKASWLRARRQLGYTMFFGGWALLISLFFAAIVSQLLTALIIAGILVISVKGVWTSHSIG